MVTGFGAEMGIGAVARAEVIAEATEAAGGRGAGEGEAAGGEAGGAGGAGGLEFKVFLPYTPSLRSA